MERGTAALLLALNVLAAGVLYTRFSDTEAGNKLILNAQALISRVMPSKVTTCGLLHWDKFTLVSERVVFPDGVRPAALHIEGGKIVSITYDTDISGPTVLSFKTGVISPGVIDVHAHLNEPGREEWEGISTGTLAAAVGGVTTVVDMPLNSDPVTTVLPRLQDKQIAAKRKAHTHVGYWGGIVPDNAARHDVLGALVKGGALGFKSFMCHSGINDFPNVEAKDIAAALPFLKRTGVPFYVHAEVVSPVAGAGEGNPRVYETYMNTRPPKFEQDAIRLLVELLDNDTTPAAPGFSVHIAHLADAGCLPIIKEAQARHPITVETCAHYLTFNKDMVPDGETQYKCAPPIRGPENQGALAAAVVSGDIALVSSDHSPAPPDMKQLDTGNFLKAWGGISGIQYLLPATWSALQPRGVGLAQLAAILSERPAALAGLAGRKGRLAVGYDADIVVWEPEHAANTSVSANQHRHKISPYTNLPLQGKTIATVVQGHFVHLLGSLTKQPCGGPITNK
uniref:allantoinase n=1 Tax=Chlamydomonas leiostraca TaxID=1034604 RepID=A0A7S0S525_9CHLO|mmetsp:Transcript_7981/g.19951  ORF Transcript_7981/g.19951 Transcript_7981/m.19951 type:complete len:510 (+) Transcript_7981:2-1531(+)